MVRTGLKILALPMRDKMLLAESVLMLFAMWCALRIWSYRTLTAYLPGAGATEPTAELAGRIAVAMRRAAFLFPDGSCLRQALAAHYMLTRRGFASSIEIGVALDERQELRAHAWLVSGQRIVTGGTRADLAQYSTFRPTDQTVL